MSRSTNELQTQQIINANVWEVLEDWISGPLHHLLNITATSDKHQNVVICEVGGE